MQQKIIGQTTPFLSVDKSCEYLKKMVGFDAYLKNYSMKLQNSWT